jgi:hypothetical protein
MCTFKLLTPLKHDSAVLLMSQSQDSADKAELKLSGVIDIAESANLMLDD